MFHFGEKDPNIPPEMVAKHRDALPQMETFTYPGADHAFNRDGSASYQEASAKLAMQRTLDFFATQLAAA
jgi:carboxymethylenebutenolidase